MKRWKVGIIGATGMVGQRFCSLLADHPWFEVAVLAASSRSAGKKYGELLKERWALDTPLPEAFSNYIVRDAFSDKEEIAKEVDFVFCAVDMGKEETKKLEEAYARLECPVVSNNAAHRMMPDIPMILPEINPEHAQIIEQQKKRLNTRHGFIAVKSNCSLQSYLPALHPLKEAFGVQNVLACTYQAVSGAGKTLESWPEMQNNVIPYIGGEEEKSEQEPLKIWGEIKRGEIVPNKKVHITTQCLRVSVLDGHMAAVFVDFKKKPSKEQIIDCWNHFEAEPQRLRLPSAPKQLLHYFTQDDRPQPKLDVMLEGGMAVSIGRLREDTQYDYKFVCLSHNTLRGAAGGAVLMAELLAAKGYFDKEE